VPDSDRPAPSEPPLSASAVSRSVQGSTVVVADDDRITRELLAQMLRGHGFNVEIVCSTS
jgi:hypothetical protein